MCVSVCAYLQKEVYFRSVLRLTDMNHSKISFYYQYLSCRLVLTELIIYCMKIGNVHLTLVERITCTMYIYSQYYYNSIAKSRDSKTAILSMLKHFIYVCCCWLSCLKGGCPFFLHVYLSVFFILCLVLPFSSSSLLSLPISLPLSLCVRLTLSHKVCVQNT